MVSGAEVKAFELGLPTDYPIHPAVFFASSKSPAFAHPSTTPGVFRVRHCMLLAPIPAPQFLVAYTQGPNSATERPHRHARLPNLPLSVLPTISDTRARLPFRNLYCSFPQNETIGAGTVHNHPILSNTAAPEHHRPSPTIPSLTGLSFPYL